MKMYSYGQNNGVKLANRVIKANTPEHSLSNAKCNVFVKRISYVIMETFVAIVTVTMSY